MACDAQTLINNAAAGKFFGLSERLLWECILYAICAAPVAPGTTAAQLVVLATAQGYSKFSDREIQEAILAALCP